MPHWPWSSKKEGERSRSVTPKATDETPSPEQQRSLSFEGRNAFSEAKYSPSIKEDQIKALMCKISGIIEKKEGNLFDFQLTAPVGNGRASMVGARVFLPRQFPMERPGWL